eukprot:COSAG01_NODE_4013_length_5434_cov_2.866354_11_plen_232_part_00
MWLATLCRRRGPRSIYGRTQAPGLRSALVPSSCGPTCMSILAMLLLLSWHALGGAAAAPPPARHARAARTVRVGRSAGADADSIGGGIALVPTAQAERWTVEVEPGIYRERVWVNASMGPLTLKGLGPADATLLVYHCCPKGDGQPRCANATLDSSCAPQHPGAGMSRGVETLLVEAADFLALNLSVANDACGYNAKRAAQSEAVQLLAGAQCPPPPAPRGLSCTECGSEM